ncbi:hypothetical protein B0T26DRAFT_718251 [Lasiosphaeria miniovina]|uniref:Uncharacterized protein n=1 Tax=Lasiosphaeria miniovina TaxID=1954250 RepID=A0AA40DW01_9PEZI|nr:uncharacterized protein B0T26DRAFT_718251 [Lasiosphaeria miniovina]KAK0713748.1 hypothetical protein B0T26DRAFT_718251 [Lasiosphaeria miniovina]
MASLTISNRSTTSDLYRSWSAVVVAYSGLKLARPAQDRLVVLNGVADEFGEALGGESTRFSSSSRYPSLDPSEIEAYVCGIWLGGMPQSLLWKQSGPGVHERITEIPSWSWASICTGVNHDLHI